MVPPSLMGLGEKITGRALMPRIRSTIVPMLAMNLTGGGAALVVHAQFDGDDRRLPGGNVVLERASVEGMVWPPTPELRKANFT